MEMKHISVIIVTWNSRETIKDCLDSVLDQKKVVTEILVIDNGSDSGTQELSTNHLKALPVLY